MAYRELAVVTTFNTFRWTTLWDEGFWVEVQTHLLRLKGVSQDMCHLFREHGTINVPVGGLKLESPPPCCLHG